MIIEQVPSKSTHGDARHRVTEASLLLRENADILRQRLKRVGLSDPAIEAAWPTWWSDDADASTSAKAELRFSLSRKLGLDPHSLLEDRTEPRFVWHDVARFKNLRGETNVERAAITSFGAALARVLTSATAPAPSIVGSAAADFRAAILDGQPFVRLLDLLSLCWSAGIPVAHLRVFPWSQKRMSAMTVEVGTRSAILLGKDSLYPAHVAFYLAHEVGHIALGHIQPGSMVIDLDRTDLADPAVDAEEAAADAFALELLTGLSRPTILPC
jgi:hypothetical protein